MASNGATFEQIASALGISEDTLSRRRRDNAEIAEAIKKGRAKGAVFVQSKLMELVSQGNLGAICFYLKCSCGWVEKRSIDHTSSDGSMSPQGMTPKEVAAELIAQAESMGDE